MPYLVDQGSAATRSGYPVLRAMVLHHGDDPVCWGIDDQYYFGDALMVAPLTRVGKSSADWATVPLEPSSVTGPAKLRPAGSESEMATPVTAEEEWWLATAMV